MSTVSEPIPAPVRNPLRLRLPPNAVPAPAPPRATWRKLPWVLGIGLAMVSLVAAGYVLQSNPGDTPSPSARDVRSGPPTTATGVVCHGSVDVESQVRALAPAQQGEIVELHVVEGKTVKEGELLLKVSEEPSQLAIKQAEAGVRAAEAQLDNAKQGIDQLRLGLEQQQAAIDGANSMYSAAQAKLKKLETLLSLNQSNQNDLEAARQEVNVVKARVTAEEAKYRQIQAMQPEAKIREAQAGVDVAKERLQAEKYKLSKCSLFAPCDGTILRLNAAKGVLLTPQTRQPPVLFCPNEPRIVRAELLPEFAHRVQPGMDAIVQDEANANITWPGKVKRLADAYLPKRSLSEAFSLSTNEPQLLECIVELAPSQSPPRIGQRVRVAIGPRP